MNKPAIAAKGPIAIAKGVQRRFGEDGGQYLAVVIGYYGFLSLFPMLILGLAVAGFIFARDPQAKSEWLRKLAEAIPGADAIFRENLDALEKNRTGASIIGLAFLIWAGLKVIEATGWALGRIFRVERIQGFVKQKTEALMLMVGIGAVALGSVVVAGIITAVEAEGSLGIALKAIGIFVTFVLDFLTFILAYRMLVPGRGPRLGQLWPGAMITSFVWTMSKLFGSLLVRSIGRGNPIYGTFATLVGALGILFLVSKVFVYGAELNAFLIERRITETGEADPAEAGIVEEARGGEPPKDARVTVKGDEVYPAGSRKT